MPFHQPISSLTIHLTPEHLGFLAYLYPNDDPEDALIKFLDCARNRAILRAEQQVRVLHPGQEEAEDLEEDPEEPMSLPGDVVENPIGALQELCQRQQISMPRYEFEVIPEGFRCAVRAMGIEGIGEGPSKKQAKVKAAGELLGLLS
ncbi:double-stranded RNA binding motif domain-containing protein [Acaryochloris marina]|uniref:double-stranded RNA binding motif domain-containing protein n=1 Tax=Acaryochloris marina TaxID=155978 RepID=UPI001BAF050D|nr:double-stranded RNA binding motif domain-containing protein [Acaryochloris marina]QUY45715.1 RNA-binding protein [Acaryochloris marina S15]